MTRLGLTAAVLAAGALLCASANASLITVQVGPTLAGPGTFVMSGAPFPGVAYSTSFGTFTSITGSASAEITSPGNIEFDSTNLSFTTSGPETLFVFITLDGLTAPPGGIIRTHSGLTTNDLNAGFSTTLWTYVDPGNHVAPPVGTALATATFTAPGTMDINSVGSTGAGPYSLQEVYEVNATRSGSAELTIHLTTSSVPEPATLGLLGTGLLTAVGAFRRRRA